MHWEAVTAIATLILAGTTFAGVGAAIYAGLYTKKVHEVAQSQRQIENSLKYVDIIKDVLSNSQTILPTQECCSYQQYFQYYQSHPQEFEVNAAGWPVSSSQDMDVNVVFRELLELFNIMSHSVLVGSANFLILYFYYGQYMHLLIQEMHATDASKANLAKYSDFVRIMLADSEHFHHLPIKEHFY